VVFTVPDKLNGLFIRYPVLMYNLLFQSAWQTINQFSFTRRQAETGMISILHTWGQNLSLHPHVHCVVPGGGVDYKGQWRGVKISENNKVFLFDVKNLSTVFRGKFMEALKKALPPDKQLVESLYKHNWVVYAKEPFAGADQVIEYLGRYTHKVAISNHRLLKVDASGVTFRWRDYRDNQQKMMTLEGHEFLRRFAQHILPKGFVRIRHYGLLSSSKKELLRELQAAFGIILPVKKERRTWKEICVSHLHYNPDVCPCCGKGNMITIERLLPSRAPPIFITNNENTRSNQH